MERLAAVVAAGIGRRPRDEWATLERLHVERLLDRLEERHDPADVDEAALRFLAALRAALPA